MRKTTWIYTKNLKIVEIFVVPRELKKMNSPPPPPPRETCHSQNFRYETLKSRLLKKLSVSHILHFEWKSRMIKGTFLSFSISTEWMNMNEYIIQFLCFWRTSESNYSLSSWCISPWIIYEWMGNSTRQRFEIRLWKILIGWASG